MKTLFEYVECNLFEKIMFTFATRVVGMENMMIDAGKARK